MIYVYTENTDGIYTKSSFENLTYAKFIAQKSGDEITAISINPTSDASELYKFGANKVIEIQSADLTNFDAFAYAKVISEYFDGKYFIFTHSNESSATAAQIAVLNQAIIISNVLDYPSDFSTFTVKRKAFSGKGIMEATTNSEKIILTILPNSIGIQENPVEGTNEVKQVSVESKTKVISSEKSTGKIQLKDAEIVISAGRGLKASENWGMIEELATKLNAATACSKPVSDIGWRPHSEHVGQTGKTIAPKLYIAIGISGAIQHLAGVNGSKVIVVINSDPEAPFFKAADYGMVGDAFDIIPKLNQLLG